MLVNAVNKNGRQTRCRMFEARKTIALVASAMSFPFANNYQTKLVALDVVDGKVR